MELGPRFVPPLIERPDYVGKHPQQHPDMQNGKIQTYTTPEEIEGLRVASKLASSALSKAIAAVKPGVTCEEIDAVVHDHIIS